MTTLGPLIASRPADLDFDRYGIVVRDRVSGHKLGGALPNTQVFTAEAGHYWQARVSNARLVPGEEHDLFRHDLTKHLEPGERWLSYGAPDGPELAWRRDAGLWGRRDTDRPGRVSRRAWDRRGACSGGPRARLGRGRSRSDADAEKAVQVVAVTVYRAGYLGSGLARRDNDGDVGIAALVRLAAGRAARSISEDAREALLAHGRTDDLAVSVVAMHDREELGPSAGIAQFKVRPGLDALTVTSAAGSRTLLPSVGPYNGWDSEALVGYLQRLRPVLRLGATWSTSRTASWVRQRRGDATSAVDRVEFGFVARPSDPVDLDGARMLTEAMAGHILGRIAPSGLPTYDLDAIRGVAVAEGTTPQGRPRPRVPGRSRTAARPTPHGLGRASRASDVPSSMSVPAASRVSSPSRASGTVRSPIACCSRQHCRTTSSPTIPASRLSVDGSWVSSGRTGASRNDESVSATVRTTSTFRPPS